MDESGKDSLVDDLGEPTILPPEKIKVVQTHFPELLDYIIPVLSTTFVVPTAVPKDIAGISLHCANNGLLLNQPPLTVGSEKAFKGQAQVP